MTSEREVDDDREAMISEMVFDGALVFKGPVDLEKINWKGG